MATSVVGQERALERLGRAAARPGHAYLLVGPTGSGIELAARAFALALIGGEGDPRAGDLVVRGLHPDVVEFEPHGFSYRIKEDVREGIIPEAMRAPVEGERKVLILHEAHRLRGNQNECANALLKTLEEPPPRTVIILVTPAPDDLLATIRSRCQRIDLDPLADSTIEQALVGEGVAADSARVAASLSGGNLARARALVGPLARLRRAFAGAPACLDGNGATVARLAAELDEIVEEGASSVEAAHAAELAEFDAEMERHGYTDREAQRLRRRIEDRHKRESRRVRIDLLLEGVSAIESVYRDALVAPGDPLNLDLPRIAVNPQAAGAAFDVCRAAREAFMVNEKGLVQLQHMLLQLPAASVTLPR